MKKLIGKKKSIYRIRGNSPIKSPLFFTELYKNKFEFIYMSQSKMIYEKSF